MSGSSGERCDDLSAPPCYISSRSADVILSDVRPTRLSIDALDAINAFLDELLHTILSAARALTTAQLRTGLHKVLPTTLGKEAVLEAELELRAYLERTGGVHESVAQDNAFNLDWTFELLRLKCEAYSTLSDTDENAEAENRLFQRMNTQGIPSPKQTLLAPASLYLTAILESICEHLVSNVGRVVARDSSRAVANAQDLFIALCEDSSIYGLFKNMSVYGRIEALSKMSRARRSVSLAHENDGTQFRRNGSRLSSDSNAPHSSRPSVDRARSVKLLYHKVSQDLINGTDPGHRKMDSYASANTKQSLASKSDRSPISPTFSEDTRSLEFDDMMRSGSTMKVSLTPDRLRTMEVFNKEKARANALQKAPSKTEKSNGITSNSTSEQAKLMTGPTPLIVRRVGSIAGSDDDRLNKPPPPSRPRQLSAATASGNTVPSFTRVRASSTTADSSTALSSTFLNKHTLSESSSAVPDHGAASRQKLPQEFYLDTSRRTQRVLHSRESLDLEDIMAGSDDGIGDLKSLASPKSPKQRDSQRGLSASTKELIAFLAEGPPELASGEGSPTMLKKSGRLQKMISRITLASDTVRPPRKMTVSSGDPSSRSMTNLSPLANRPVPPRYPTSGPSSAASSERGSGDQAGALARQRAQSFVQNPFPVCDGKSMEGEAATSAVPSLSPGMEEGHLGTTTPVSIISQRPLEIDVSQPVQPIKSPSPTFLPPPATPVTAPVRTEAADAAPMPSVQLSPSTAPQRLSSKTASSLRQKVALSPTSQTPPLPAPSVLEHAREMRTMLERATSAAECRILVDMFLARAKLVDMVNLRVLSAAPPPRETATDGLEGAIVELFLGEGELDSRQIPSLNLHSAGSDELLSENPDVPSIPLANRTTEASEPC